MVSQFRIIPNSRKVIIDLFSHLIEFKKYSEILANVINTLTEVQKLLLDKQKKLLKTSKTYKLERKIYIINLFDMIYGLYRDIDINI